MATDEELITRTVRDCFEAWHDAGVAWMDRALHPGLVKRWPAEDGGAILPNDVRLRACAGDERTGAAGRWLTIGIADVCGGIAGAVVRPAPYPQYPHLIGTGGEWTMAAALWRPQ